MLHKKHWKNLEITLNLNGWSNPNQLGLILKTFFLNFYLNYISNIYLLIFFFV